MRITCLCTAVKYCPSRCILSKPKTECKIKIQPEVIGKIHVSSSIEIVSSVLCRVSGTLRIKSYSIVCPTSFKIIKFGLKNRTKGACARRTTRSLRRGTIVLSNNPGSITRYFIKTGFTTSAGPIVSCSWICSVKSISIASSGTAVNSKSCKSQDKIQHFKNG